MSKVQQLRAVVKQRLTAAAEEIFGLFERTIAEYEEELCRSKEENERQRQLLDAVFKPQLRLRRADVQQLSGSKDEVRPEQQDWSPGLDQEDPPQLPDFNQEELWTGQELQEADITKFTFSPVSVKSEADDEEEEPQSSQLHPSQTEHFQPECEVSDDWKTGDPQEEPGVAVSNQPAEKLLSCSECGKSFSRKYSLQIHRRVHTGEKPFSCLVCGKRFRQRSNFMEHTRRHTGQDTFNCALCGKKFAFKYRLRNHMRSHTGEKPFSCPFCEKSFVQNHYLKIHMSAHMGEKPFSCSFSDKSFVPNRHLALHVSAHEQEKHEKQLKTHRCVGESSQPDQSPSEESRDAEPSTSCSAELMEADGEDCGGPGPAWYSGLGRPLQPDADNRSLQSEPECKVSDDWKTGDPQEEPGVAVSNQPAEKLLSCSECGKSFSRKYSLQIHRRVHTGEKPFSCLVCGKRFRQRSNFMEHTRRHTGQDTFNCALCGKKFAFKYRLRNHMRSHTGEKLVPPLSLQ